MFLPALERKYRHSGIITVMNCIDIAKNRNSVCLSSHGVLAERSRGEVV